MKGDFSRVSFNPSRSFSSVLQQQGRATLDADINEQQAINLHLMRTLAADLIGQHGGPGDSFHLQVLPDDSGAAVRLTLSPGNYYVDGWLCENIAAVGYKAAGNISAQPWLREAPDPVAGDHLAYLEIWERHVAPAENDRAGDPAAPDALREVALEGPETASRAQVVWQLRLQPLAGGVVVPVPLDDQGWKALQDQWWPPAHGQLKAKAAEPRPDSGSPCIVSPQSRYRGLGNQLYRVEIVRGGAAGGGNGATWAWSRENGAVIFPVETIAGQTVKLADVWRDARFAIGVGDIVEVADDTAGLAGPPPQLHKVVDYDPDTATVTLDATPAANTDAPLRPVLLRRWDHGQRTTLGPGGGLADDNALPLVENSWLRLEEGIEVWFEKGAAAGSPEYRSGDYWLIPARVPLGDILWPREAGAARAPALRPPHGVERHYAPLGVVRVAPSGVITVERDLRRLIPPLAVPT